MQRPLLLAGFTAAVTAGTAPAQAAPLAPPLPASALIARRTRLKRRPCQATTHGWWRASPTRSRASTGAPTNPSRREATPATRASATALTAQPRLAANISPMGSITYCETSGGTAQISFYDVPTAPTSYPPSAQDPRSYPEILRFVVPSRARFIADVQVTQGATAPPCTARPRALPLSALEAGAVDEGRRGARPKDPRRPPSIRTGPPRRPGTGPPRRFNDQLLDRHCRRQIPRLIHVQSALGAT